MLKVTLEIIEKKYGKKKHLTLIEISLILLLKMIVLRQLPLKLFTNFLLTIHLPLLSLFTLVNIVSLILGELEIIYKIKPLVKNYLLLTDMLTMLLLLNLQMKFHLKKL